MGPRRTRKRPKKRRGKTACKESHQLHFSSGTTLNQTAKAFLCSLWFQRPPLHLRCVRHEVLLPPLSGDAPRHQMSEVHILNHQSAKLLPSDAKVGAKLQTFPPDH